MSYGDFIDNNVSTLETAMAGFDSANSNWNSDFIVTAISNKFFLEIHPYDDIPLDFDVDVTLDISYTYQNFPDGIQQQQNHQLKVNYTTDAHTTFKKIDLLELRGGQLVQFNIDNFSVDQSLSNTQLELIKDKLIVKTYTKDTRYYHKHLFNPIISSDIQTSYNATKKEIIITWSVLEYAEAYDIQWLFLDSYEGGQSSTSNVLKPEIEVSTEISTDSIIERFQKASKLAISSNTITIPAVGGKSRFVCRVRPTGKIGKDFHLQYEAPWSEVVEHLVPIVIHEGDKLNYQSIITYAEDSKYKIVNQYFDGRMASRQKVTKLQSNNFALVQESIYDKIGRKAIEVLPAPVKSNDPSSEEGTIMYYDNFNRNAAGTKPYSAEDFEEATCVNTPEPMSTISGASKYYSSTFFNELSPQEKESELALIPDAFQYPFSQTRFMNDNTNRPLAQGGVGKDHHIGSTRETEITYTTPTQSELDRLFGTEVGLAKYYKKVITEDPNNQVSIAYQDIKGNTIATSLYGTVDNLTDLASYQAVQLTDDLTGFNQKSMDNYEITSGFVFFVPDNNKDYNFDYSLTPAQFSMENCQQICYDCIYDLTIKLVNTDCNKTILSLSKTIGYLDEDLQTIDATCNSSSWNAESDLTLNEVYREEEQTDPSILNLTLNKGNYIIKKILKVNETAADKYVEDFVTDTLNTCIKSFDEFLEESINELLDEPCEINCNDVDSPSEDADIVQMACDSINNKCETIRRAMISDFNPNGQYAEYNIDGQGNWAGENELSIFSDNNIFGTYNTPIDFRAIISNAYPDVEIIDKDLDEIITTLWNPEWAKLFLVYHPEYCYLQNCNDCSAEYEGVLQSISSASIAMDMGLLNPTDPADLTFLLDNDPYFSNSPNWSDAYNDCEVSTASGIDFYTQIQGEIQNFFAYYPDSYETTPMSLYDVAVYNICNGTAYDSLTNTIDAQIYNECIASISFATSDTELADLLWLQVKNLYLYLKEKYEYQNRTLQAISEGCHNVCIGATDNQNCNGIYSDLYATKMKRFPSVHDMPGMEGIDDIYNLNQIGENVDQLVDNAVTGLTTEFGCVIEGNYQNYSDGSFYNPTDTNTEIQTDKMKCIEYACLSELPQFFKQFITILPSGLAEFKPNQDMPIEQPACFQGSPFIDYQWRDGSLSLNQFNMSGTIESEAVDRNHCIVSLNFEPFGDSDWYDYEDMSPGGFPDFITSISYFDNFELSWEALEDNGESNVFTAIAYSNKLAYADPNADLVSIQVFGSISCATLGRCCVDGVEGAIEACLNIPNVDNPTSIEEELWLDDANPYFDPLWIQNPCNVPDDLDFLTINCKDNPACCTPADSLSYDFDWNYDCTGALEAYAYHNATILYEQYIEETKSNLKHRYMLKCLDAAEIYTMEHESGEHHFVLSYYDQAGNLTRTVPPNGTFDYDPDTNTGTDLTFSSQAQLDAVANARANNTEYKPDYSVWDTRYTYNSLNQITTQNLPDHGSETALNQTPSRDGISKFYYDKLGRLILSQSPQQIADGKYSYTKYDNLGRIMQSGQLYFNNSSGFEQQNVFNPYGDYVSFFIDSPLGQVKEQITHTYYDEGTSQAVQANFPEGKQENLRSRVAYAAYYETEQDLQQQKPSSASYYDYDELGNVKSLLQFLDKGYSKMIEYDYDLVSGNVNKVYYQRGEKDQFIHKYNYDADNRITEVHSSLDNCIWDKEAKYYYYPHGPLARVELGDEEIQGMDYIYTIHGWIKGVNSIALDAERDAGKDGFANSINASFAPDEMGYMLNYYEGDYFSISGSQDFEPAYVGQAPNLYNGNIRNMSTSIGEIIRQNQDSYGYISNDYAYDQLNRIKEMRPFDSFDADSNSWGTISPPGQTWDNQPYYTNYQYDGNGNIFNLQRNGAVAQPAMDQLKYRYLRQNNQLTAVNDIVGNNNYPLDPSTPNAIHDFDNNIPSSYFYDRNGNLIKDLNGKLDISWNVQGKVQSIIDNNGFPNNEGPSKNIEFKYDPLGNRIAKIIDDEATLYVRDAQGNLLSTYKKEKPPTTPVFANYEPNITWKSAYIYGSDRVGAYKANTLISGNEGSLQPPVVAVPQVSIPTIPQDAPAQDPTTSSTLGDANGLLIKDIDFSLLYEMIPTYTGTIGTLTTPTAVPSSEQASFDFAAKTSQFLRGEKQYELTNHLGNVLTTLSDRKHLSPSQGDGTSPSEELQGVVTTATDYYSGGMVQPKRFYLHEDASTRYKHQGQESDDEIAGIGTNYFYKYRMSDARLNRFWSVDPLYAKYPYNSQYAFSENRMIDGIEIEGLQAMGYEINHDSKTGNTKVEKVESKSLFEQMTEKAAEVMSDIATKADELIKVGVTVWSDGSGGEKYTSDSKNRKNILSVEMEEIEYLTGAARSASNRKVDPKSVFSKKWGKKPGRTSSMAKALKYFLGDDEKKSNDPIFDNAKIIEWVKQSAYDCNGCSSPGASNYGNGFKNTAARYYRVEIGGDEYYLQTDGNNDNVIEIDKGNFEKQKTKYGTVSDKTK